MKNDYSLGIKYASNGVRDFYKYKFLWKYTLVPLAAVLLLHIGVWLWILKYLQPILTKKFASMLPEWLLNMLDLPLADIAAIMSWTMAVIFLSMVTNMVYEFIAAFFFPAMVKEYENKILKIETTELTKTAVFRNCMASGYLNILIIVLLILLSWMVLFLPVAGMIFFLMIMGYQYSILFMSEAAFSRNCRLSDIRYLFARRSSLMYGFGMFSFFMVQIPFLSPFLYPGFVLGAAKLFNDEAEGI